MCLNREIDELGDANRLFKSINEFLFEVDLKILVDRGVIIFPKAFFITDIAGLRISSFYWFSIIFKVLFPSISFN